MSVKAALIPVNEDPQIIEIEPDQNGHYLYALQALVGGLIDAFDPLYGDTPLL